MKIGIYCFRNDFFLMCKIECSQKELIFNFKIVVDFRAQPDWAYEFLDRTGPDTQICRTGPAGPDWIRTYIFNILPNKYGLSITIWSGPWTQIWCQKI